VTGSIATFDGATMAFGPGIGPLVDVGFGCPTGTGGGLRGEDEESP
jgi:hypothetical protein